MNNKQIARLLKETAQLLELTGSNPFRIRAYSQAARALERLEQPASDLLAEGTLEGIPGIGKGLAAQIAELSERGSFGVRDDLLATVPPGLLDVLQIKGLGPKKVRTLWQTLGVTSLESLEAAAESGQIAQLQGFGARTATALLDNLQALQAHRSRRRYADALPPALSALNALRREQTVLRAELTGDLRRCMETVDRVEILFATKEDGAVLPAWMTNLPRCPVENDHLVESREGRLPDGLPMIYHRVLAGRFGTAWWFTTGARTYVEDAIRRKGPLPTVPAEADLFRFWNIPFRPPELREVPTIPIDPDLRLITVEVLRGTLHNHTTYSDGTHTLAEMAEAARDIGLEYLGVSDHSRSLRIANGMPVERVRLQQEEIRRLNERYARDSEPFRILSGIECDILADGSLDYPDEVLATFDFVVASIHSGFNMTEEEATERILRAVAHPATCILGHPTGRLLLARSGYPIDHPAVIAACAAHGVAIELNASPHRLDLDWRWIHEATRRGVLISINPDAHTREQLGNVRWGVAVARKGALTPDQCLNACSLEELLDWLRRRRSLPPESTGLGRRHIQG